MIYTKMSINKLRIFFSFALLFSASLCVAQEDGLKADGGVVIDKRKNATYFSDGLQCKYREDVLGAIRNFEQALQFMPNDAASMYELSDQYVNAGRMEDAFRSIRKAVELEPENKWYQLRLGKFYRNYEMYDDFVKLYEKLTEKYPDDIDALSELIDVYLICENYNQALKKIDLLEKQMGSNELISEQRIAIYQRQGDKKKMIAELQKMVDNDPQNARYYSMLAQIYMDSGEEKEALKMYEKVKENNPNDPYINVSLLEFYEKKGDNDKAFKELISAIRNKNLDFNTKLNIYDYWFQKASEKVADEQARQAGQAFVETYPDNKIGYIVLGNYHLKKQDFQQSKDMYAKVLSLDSTDFLAWQNIIFSEADLKDNEAVLEHSVAALKYYPMQPIFYWYAGVGSAIFKQTDEAIRYLEKGRKYCADRNLQTSFDSNLGDLYYETGEMEKAFSAYDKVLAVDPDNALVLNNYAYYLSLKGEDLDKAIEMASHAIGLEPKNATYLDTYAWVLYKNGNYKEAEKQMKKAIENAQNPDGLYFEHYGDILFKMGDTKKAIENWEKAQKAGGYSEKLEQKLKDGTLYE